MQNLRNARMSFVERSRKHRSAVVSKDRDVLRFKAIQAHLNAKPIASESKINFQASKFNFCVHGKRYLFSSSSLGLFDEGNFIRQVIVWLITWKRFDQFILVLILMNSIILAITDYSWIDPDSGELITKHSMRNTIVEAADPVFTALFTIECGLKVVGMGLIGGSGAYLRNPWNWLDFVVAASGILTIIPGVPNVSALRTFRVLRPLRSLNAVAGMKKLVSSLLKSIPELINVIAFLGFIFFIFGIFGIQLWSGELHARCRSTPYPIRIHDNASFPISKTYLEMAIQNPLDARCAFGNGTGIPIENIAWTHDTSPWTEPRYCIWPVAPHDHERICRIGQGQGNYKCPTGQTCGSNYDAYGNARFTHADPKIAKILMEEPDYTVNLAWGYTNFDHIGYAFLTIFQCITMEGWVDIMYMVQDAGYAPVAAVYFVLLILVGSFFMLNLTLAVIWDNFSRANESDKQDQDEKRIQKEIKNAKRKAPRMKHRSKYGIMAEHIVNHWAFSLVITCLIVLNTIVLSLDQYPSDPALEYYVELLNFILTFAFTIETAIKILGLGFTVWSDDKLNIFDAFIVLVSIIELIVAPPEFDINSTTSRSGGALSALRTFRLFRIFKLARSWTSLQELLVTMVKTLSQIGNFSVLLVLFMYIYALIGMQFFAFKYRFDENGYPVDRSDQEAYKIAFKPRSHFDTLLAAFTSIFQILTAENWNTLMYDGWRSSGWTAALYFVSLVILGNFIVLNLFLAILLGNFQSAPVVPEKSGSGILIDRGSLRKLNMLASVGNLTKTKIFDKSLKNGTALLERSDNASKFPTRSQNDADRTSFSNPGLPMVKSELPRSKTEITVRQATVPRHKLSNRHRLSQERSLFLFAPTNALRLLATKISLNKSFENTILVLIILSSVALAIDNPLLNPSSSTAIIVGFVDTLFTLIFIVEMMLKIIVKGFVLHKRSYLRSGWNILDFIIVIISILALVASGNSQLKSFRSLRTFRALRPLRMISRNPGLKLVVNSLFASLPQILNVMMVCLLFFTIFSIIGVNYFKGRFYSCQGSVFELLSTAQQDLVTYPVTWPELSSLQKTWFNSTTSASYAAIQSSKITSRDICSFLGATWAPSINQNFNNVFQGISTLFEMSTTEQWVEVMFTAIDTTAIDMQPIRDNTPEWAFFFVAFMVIGSFFIMQLFVGVVIDNFNKMKEKLGDSILLTESQKEWVHMQEAMLKLKPLRRKRVPRTKYRKFCYYLAHDTSLEILVMTCIVLNTVIMALVFFGQDNTYTMAIETANYLFASIFFVEAIIKVAGLGAHYWRDWWNVFDFAIVLGSTVGILLHLTTSTSVGPLATVIRTFRVGRVFRLVKSAPTLQQLFNTLLITLPSLANIGTLLFLMYYIYSVMGMQLFAKVKHGEYLNDQSNFQTFGTAMLTLIRSSTGENWNGLMYDCMQTTNCANDPAFDPQKCGFNNTANCIPINGCGTPLAFVYYISFTLIVSFVLLNVFIAVILEGFSNEKDQSSSTLTDEEYEDFVHSWSMYDPDATCFIAYQSLFPLLQKLEPPMGFGKYHKATRKEIHLLITALEIPIYKGNRVFFSDVSQRIAKHIIQTAYGETLQPLPDDHNVVRKWQQAAKASAHPREHSIAEYGVNDFYAAVAIHSAIKQYKFRSALKSKVHHTAHSKST